MTPPRHPGPYTLPSPDRPTSPGEERVPRPPDRPTSPGEQRFPLPPVDRPTGQPLPPLPPLPPDPPAPPRMPEQPPWQSPPLFPGGTPPERPSGEAEVVTGELEAVVARLREALRELAEAFNRCVEAVRNAGGALADVLVAGVLSALGRAREFIEAVLRVGGYVLEHCAPLIALIITSFTWLDNVAKPATAIAERIGDSGVDLYEWEGKAAGYYRARLGDQQAAATGVATTAVTIGEWLLAIARQNVGYTQRLTDLVVSLAAAVGQAAVEAATIVLIPLAIDTLKDEVGTIIEGLGQHVAGAVTRLMDTLGTVHEMKSVEVTNTGNWPTMVAG